MPEPPVANTDALPSTPELQVGLLLLKVKLGAFLLLTGRLTVFEQLRESVIVTV